MNLVARCTRLYTIFVLCTIINFDDRPRSYTLYRKVDQVVQGDRGVRNSHSAKDLGYNQFDQCCYFFNGRVN